MKWINLWIKKLQIISTRNCIQFATTTVILYKSNKHQEVKKKHDFEMSMPSCRMCCTIMIGVPITKSFSSSLTPEILSFCPKSLL